MDGEACRLCGGDGRIDNALARSSTTCPGCHGSGRRADTSFGFHDVTKTKPSHHRAPAAAPSGPRQPVTPEGVQLVAEIVNHESTHGRCTKTSLKKIRKQARPGG